MTSRHIVVGPESANVACDAADELAVLLEERGSFERTNALVGIDASSTATSPQATLSNALEALCALKTDFVLIDGTDTLDARTFDTVSWNLELATSAQAGVVLILDAEGVGAELFAKEIRAFIQRVEVTRAKLVVVVLPADIAPTVEAEMSVLSLPLSAQALGAPLAILTPSALTSPAFQANLTDRARAQRKRTAMPELEDDRVSLAVAEMLTRGIADITFVGETNAVSARTAEFDIDLSAALAASVDDPAYTEEYVAEFVCLRARKGVTIEQTREKIKDASCFAVLMAHMDDVGDTVSGAAHTITHVIVPSFQITKTTSGVSIVSSISLMFVKDQVWAFDDCAANPNPAPEQLADIVVTLACTAAQFGVRL